MASEHAVLASSTVLSTPSLAQHVAGAQRGEATAMRALLEGLAPTILATARQIMGQREDAEDAAQEAMHDFARDLGGLREPAAVVAFARRLTARVALRHRARRKRDSERVREMALDGSAPRSQSASTGIAEEQAERLRDHIEQLPEAQALAIVMQHMLGYRPAEIAAATGVPVNTVRSRVRLAREALARSLAQDPSFDRQESEAS